MVIPPGPGQRAMSAFAPAENRDGRRRELLAEQPSARPVRDEAQQIIHQALQVSFKTVCSQRDLADAFLKHPALSGDNVFVSVKDVPECNCELIPALNNHGFAHAQSPSFWAMCSSSSLRIRSLRLTLASFSHSCWRLNSTTCVLTVGSGSRCFCAASLPLSLVNLLGIVCCLSWSGAPTVHCAAPRPGPKPLVGAAFLCGSGGCVLANPADQELFKPVIVLAAVSVHVVWEVVVSGVFAEPGAERVASWR